jgi:Predicted divalent heavy-metal cations transporter
VETGAVLLSLVVTSLFSAVGAFFLYTSEGTLQSVLPYLISLSAGTIFGGVFLHLLFRLSNKFGYTRLTGLLVLAGLGGSFLLERALHWHTHQDGGEVDSLPYVLATGDSIHNLLDGVLIATGFLASSSSGVAATVAVVAHKVPKELGDFGVMVDGGFSRLEALGVNIGVSVFMFLGAGLVLGISQVSGSTVKLLLPLVVGNFVYIAGTDLLPQFKDTDRWVLHSLVFSVGVGAMYLIPFIKAAV